MSLESEFRRHITENQLQLQKQRVLLAVSGGLDSVVLAHLCHKLKLNMAIAHCNFNLRAAESDGDSNFVKALAENLDVKCHLQSFNTRQYAEDHKTSIQVSARQLRYQWFFKLCKNFKYDALLTAHHLNDDVETFFINLSRSTGLEGLTGIPAENKNIIRPLLPFSRNQILSYAEKERLQWREDSSNASDNYMRNAIRHHIVPKLEELNTQFLQNFKSTQGFLKEASILIEDYTQLIFNDVVSETEDGFEFSIKRLKRYKNLKAVLFQLLKDFDFTEWDNVLGLLSAQTGKFVTSATHRLIKNRDTLLLTTIGVISDDIIAIDECDAIARFPHGTLHISEVQDISETGKNILYADKETMTFPLLLRPWREGDKFKPLGMKGTKKLSDFLKDEKLSLPQKEQIYVLLSDGKIAWVVGQRADNRHKVTPKTTTILKMIWHT